MHHEVVIVGGGTAGHQRRRPAAPGRRGGHRPRRAGRACTTTSRCGPSSEGGSLPRSHATRRGVASCRRGCAGSKTPRSKSTPSRVSSRPPRRPHRLRRARSLPRPRARLGPRAGARRSDGDAVCGVELHRRARPEECRARAALPRRRGDLRRPGSPIKCPGAPQKAAYLACDHWQRTGTLRALRVTYRDRRRWRSSPCPSSPRCSSGSSSATG